MNWLAICNVDFDKGYNNVISFVDIADQSQYFNSLANPNNYYYDLSVIHDFSQIRVYGNVNKLYNYNYCFFENEIDGEIKRYYAFINSITWEGIDVASINITVDNWQTWQFNFEFLPSSVERGHVKRTELRYLFTPENIDVGNKYLKEEVLNLQDKTPSGEGIYWLWIISDELPTAYIAEKKPFPADSRRIYRFYNDHSLIYQYCISFIPLIFSNIENDLTTYFRDATDPNGKNIPFISYIEALGRFGNDLHTLKMFISSICPFDYTFGYISEGGKLYPQFTFNGCRWANLEGWNNQSALPSYLTNCIGGYFGVSTGVDTRWWSAGTGFNKREFNYSYAVNFDEFIKLDLYPFSYYSLSQFRNDILTIDLKYLINNQTGCQIEIEYINPLNINFLEGYAIKNYLGEEKYNVVVNNKASDLTLMTDSYKNYIYTSLATEKAGLRRNENNLLTSMLGIGSDFIGSVATMNFTGAWKQGIKAVTAGLNKKDADSMIEARRADAASTPDNIKEAGNNFELEFLNETLSPQLVKYSLPLSMYEKALNYFKHYGYTINEKIIPDYRSQKAYNYIKTSNAVLKGNVSQDILLSLETIFDTGTTIWHWRVNQGIDFHGIGNYNVENEDYNE